MKLDVNAHQPCSNHHDTDPLLPTNESRGEGLEAGGTKYGACVEEKKECREEEEEEDERREEEDGHNSDTWTATVYKRRFWILTLYSALCFVHNAQWITWGPISETMEQAFPGWGSSTVALLTNWPGIVYVVTFLPGCWAVQRYGLRAATLVSGVLMTIGTALRCITSVTPAFTVMCHLCAILVGCSAPFVLAAIPLLAATWFPTRERTTALAVLMGAHQMGGLGSYLEPLLVSTPSPSTTTQELRHDVMLLMYVGVAVSGVLLVAALVYFPSKPPTPPSFTSSAPRTRIMQALRSMFRNKRLGVLLVCYAVFAGPPLAWVTVLDYSLKPLGFRQDDSMWVGVVTVIASSVVPVVSGRINDLFRGHIKLQLALFMAATSICCYWFLLLSYGVIPVSTWQVYVSVVGAVSFSYTTLPLFLEACSDLSYPAPEFLVSGVMVAADIIFMFLFLLAFNIPNVGYLWMTYTLTLTSSFTILPLLGIKFDTTRADLDTNNAARVTQTTTPTTTTPTLEP